MNIVTVPKYEDIEVCPICLEQFQPYEMTILIQHYMSKQVSDPNDPSYGKTQNESDQESRRKQHIFHSSCIRQYLDRAKTKICPLDRVRIHRLLESEYHQIVAINLLCFNHNYYELLDQYPKVTLAVVDSMNLNCRDHNGKTLLYCACQRGLLKIVKKLVQAGGHPVLADNQGFTPLMAAISHNHIKLVRYLLTLPIVRETINYCDHKGQMAIDYAKDNNLMIKELMKVRNLDCIKLKLLRTRANTCENVNQRGLISHNQDCGDSNEMSFPKQKIMKPRSASFESHPIVQNEETKKELKYVNQSCEAFTNASEHELTQLSTFNSYDSSLIYRPQSHIETKKF